MSTPAPDIGFDPAALIAAILFPGAGHALRGDKARGAIIGAGILGLFFGGIFVGGVDVVDRREDRVWFLGQALVGPIAFGTDWYHQKKLKVLDPGEPDPMTGRPPRLRSAYPGEGRDPANARPIAGGSPPNKKSIGKVNELGTLFATIAGMMNLIVILDAGFPNVRVRKNTGQGAGQLGSQNGDKRGGKA
jgi:hypothetical protein